MNNEAPSDGVVRFGEERKTTNDRERKDNLWHQISLRKTNSWNQLSLIFFVFQLKTITKKNIYKFIIKNNSYLLYYSDKIVVNRLIFN